MSMIKLPFLDQNMVNVNDTSCFFLDQNMENVNTRCLDIRVQGNSRHAKKT